MILERSPVPFFRTLVLNMVFKELQIWVIGLFENLVHYPLMWKYAFCLLWFFFFFFNFFVAFCRKSQN
jgi:hypothetical protein